MIETATLRNAFPPTPQALRTFSLHLPLLVPPFHLASPSRTSRARARRKARRAKRLAGRQPSARKRAIGRQIAQANYRCGYLAAENDMLRKMIALSVGVKRGTFNDRLAENGLKLLPGGNR